MYPTWFVEWVTTNKGDLGDARFVVAGWTFLFRDGALRVSEPNGVHVIVMSKESTEEFVVLVRALDSGRFDPTFKLKGER
jgi:hypothetical protein